MTLVEVAARLVNHLTSGWSAGQEVAAPQGAARVTGTAEALGGDGRRTPRVSPAEADALAGHAASFRAVFEAVHEDDVASAVVLLNTALAATGARPQLDPLPEGGGWHVHFHGSDDSLAVGWAAGCTAGLALAVGSDLAGRLGVCGAERCDRVFVDLSRNAGRRFCSTACQNRTKTAAYRARR
ncbi:CGNR zinc finger domain-containing protein [Nocardioides luti]|uniref:CGNR zinc finger domain-containing protein n=1 Tax=Nocardioides luti TaxID=2761101 RepID=UPI0031B626A0